MSKGKSGLIPVLHVKGDCLAEATCNAWLACYEHGVRVLNVKHAEEDPLAYDAMLTVEVVEPLSEPMIFMPGLPGDQRSLEAYRLEVLFGTMNHGVGRGWDYTYNQRFSEQIAPMLKRMEDTWLDKGRLTSRDYQITTWEWKTDTVIDDPPCLQIVYFRLLKTDYPDHYKVNMIIVFRSRDLGNAFWMNAYAFIEFQRYITHLISNMMAKYGLTFSVGKYVDSSFSNHLYGRDETKKKLLQYLEDMKRKPWQNFAMDIERFLPRTVKESVWHEVAAQRRYLELTAETSDYKILPTREDLERFSIDWRNFPYPEEWAF